MRIYKYILRVENNNWKENSLKKVTNNYYCTYNKFSMIQK